MMPSYRCCGKRAPTLTWIEIAETMGNSSVKVVAHMSERSQRGLFKKTIQKADFWFYL